MAMSFCLTMYRQKTHDRGLEHIEQLNSNSFKIIFLGDSMFERYTWVRDLQDSWSEFQKMGVFNAGIGGDRVQHVLYRVKNQGLLRYAGNPKKLLLMIGSNDVERTRVQNMSLLASYVAELVDVIKKDLPNTEIILLCIPPRLSAQIPNDDMIDRCGVYNNYLHKIAEEHGVRCEDFWGTYDSKYRGDGVTLDKDDTMFSDEVHFSDLGYVQFTRFLKELLVK